LQLASSYMKSASKAKPIGEIQILDLLRKTHTVL